MGLTKKSDRLGTEAIIPLLFKLSAPAIVGMLIQSLYNIVDSIYLGRLSKEALAAVSLSFPVQMILVAIGVGTGVGTSSLISRLLGRGATDRANSVVEHVLLITLFYSIIVTIIGVFFSSNIMSIFTDNMFLINLSNSYIRIILIGSLALFFPMVVNNVLRGEGNTFVPMLTMVIGAVLNIILDPFLIFGIGIFPELGIEGAAYATIFSRAVGAIFIAFILFSDRNQIKLSWESFKKFKFDFQIIKNIYQVGFPAMALQLSASVMIAGVNMIIANYNTLAIAVFGIYFRLQSFIFLPIVGLNQGYMPIVGYNYGHNKPLRMKKTIKYGLMVSFLFTIVGFVIFQVFPRQLILLFNKNQELLEIGTVALKRVSMAFPIMGPALVASTTFQAVGKGFPSLIHSVTRQIVILLPLMYLMGEFYGLATLWLALPIAELIAALIVGVWLFVTMRDVFARMKEKNERQKRMESKESLS
jgi:putative MATE family efflux protein